MIIKLLTGKNADSVSRNIKPGTTIGQVCESSAELFPYTVVAAKVNHKIVPLSFEIDEECTIEPLDIRTQAANLIYQNSLALIYLKAVEDVCGNASVVIQNSLNKGLYTEIRNHAPVTDAVVAEIEKRMGEIVELDFPLKREVVTREQALEMLTLSGRTERSRIIESVPELSWVSFYELDGYRDFFYGLMVPSTGYIKHFELRKYNHGVLVRFPHPSKPDEIPPYVDEKKLYYAFEEQSEWDKLLGVDYVCDLNDKIESGEYKELIQLSEALHEKKIAQIADEIKQHHKRIVLIAGPSSSGKTTFARRLCVQLRVNGLSPLYLGTDDYFIEREDTPLDENGEKDFESIGALDIELFNRNMNDLLAGKTVDLPSFDFLTGHKEFGKRITSLQEGQPIVIEGIHGLNEQLTEFIPKDEKFKIYISPLTQLNIDIHNRIPTTDERMLRRLVRDNLYRGHSAASTIKNWPKVRAGEDRNIFPYSGEADVLFNSYHVYEIAVLRKYAEPLLRQITPKDEEFAEAQRMLQFLDFFRTIEDDSMIVNNSIIREFIGGSIFVS